MYRYQNLTRSFGKLSHLGNYVNSLQLINLYKHDIYPHFNNKFMQKVSTNIIVHSGKLLIDMEKYDNKTNKFKFHTIFAENELLYETEEDHDIILTDQKYIITIYPGIYYSFYSYDNDTLFQLFYKSDGIISEYSKDRKNNYRFSKSIYI